MLAADSSDCGEQTTYNREPQVDIWAGLNLAALCRHLSLAGDEQTHPWDPVVVAQDHSHENFGSHGGKPEGRKAGRPGSGRDKENREMVKRTNKPSDFTGERELVRHLFALKRTARIAEKSVIFGRTVRPKRVGSDERE